MAQPRVPHDPQKSVGRKGSGTYFGRVMATPSLPEFRFGLQPLFGARHLSGLHQRRGRSFFAGQPTGSRVSQVLLLGEIRNARAGELCGLKPCGWLEIEM